MRAAASDEPFRREPGRIGAAFAAGVLLVLSSAIPVGAAGSGEKAAYTVTTAHTEALGTYLTDARGKTLYYSTDDLPGLSNCTAGCEAVWPPFSAATISVPPTLHSSDFGYITRGNGRRQVTYKGWPLYYYSRDWAPRDTNGQALYGTWYVVQPDLFGPPGS